MSDTIDINKLEQEFDIENVENEIKKFRDIIDSIPDPGNADEILKTNIKRANHLLDLAEDMIAAGNLTPRILEVSAKLIDSITSASNTLISAELQGQNLDLKDKALEIKKYEIDNRTKQNELQQINQQNNIITVGSREDILDKIFNMDRRDNSQIKNIEIESKNKFNENKLESS